jgi:hypothetical protein
MRLVRKEAVRIKSWKCWLFIQRNSVWIIGIVIGGLGIWGMWKCPEEIGQKLSEAILIAGVLSISVDVWLKRKLQEEAAKDLFQHLLGMNLPKELRRALQRLIEESAIYRKDVDISVHVEDKDDSVILTVTLDAVNVGAKDSTYRQYLTLEEAYEGKPLYASLRTSKEPVYALTEDKLCLKEKLPEEPMVWHWEGKEMPIGYDDELIQYTKFTVKRSRKDFYIIFFGRPTIHPTLRVTGSETLNIYASVDDDTSVNGNEYVYTRVFLRGDHIQIRWKPKEDKAVAKMS